MAKEDLKRKIDIRIMKLNKWYVPKSVDLNDRENPVILGYFDELQIEEVTKEDISMEECHPFTAGYRSLITWKSIYKEDTVDCSSQEQILFLNISDDEKEEGVSFAEKTVQVFWEKEKDNIYPYLFVSMIHINHSGNLVNALKKIKATFMDDYLSYVSYDYCDIVLFVQNMQIPEFMDKIKKLFEVEAKEEKVVFDTFSMVSFHPQYSRNQLSGLCQKRDISGEAANEKFQATINLSIRDHRAFDKWYQTEIEEPGVTIEYYDLFGRHDISITKENADTEWLMQIMNKLHDKRNHKKFWTFETFIKIKKEPTINTDLISIDPRAEDELEKIHKKVSEKLQYEIKELKEAIDRSKLIDKNRYILPVYEVRDCICSIVKNSFAEEFVCCIYESFLHFVSYMTVEIKKINTVSDDEYRREENKIAEVYDKYFIALNTLVNSTMHSERQFVQATAFNAVFYSVPPKIMAFYNAYVYRMRQILKDENAKEYTFLIYPSFSPIMSVKRISLDAPPPCDRILTVTISESSLYDIESVMYQIVHELAHYVGRNLRCRSVRKKKILKTLLRWIVDECRMGDEIYRILECLTEEKQTDGEGKSDIASSLYLEYLPQIGAELFKILGNRDLTYNLFKEYYENLSLDDERCKDRFLIECGIEMEYQKAYIENFNEQYASVKWQGFCRKLLRLDDFDRTSRYKSCIQLIQYVYRECYADLQMIFVLGMGAGDYLNTFLINLKIPFRNLLSLPKDLVRISAVFRTMTSCGLWKIQKNKTNENFWIVYSIISDYNKAIEKYTEKDRISASREKAEILAHKAALFDFEKGIHLKGYLSEDSVSGLENAASDIVPLAAVAAGLYEYLLEVTEVSLEEYSKTEKKQKICEARELIRKMLDFNDITEVFNCVEEELIYYKREGCRI